MCLFKNTEQKIESFVWIIMCNTAYRHTIQFKYVSLWSLSEKIITYFQNKINSTFVLK